MWLRHRMIGADCHDEVPIACLRNLGFVTNANWFAKSPVFAVIITYPREGASIDMGWNDQTSTVISCRELNPMPGTDNAFAKFIWRIKFLQMLTIRSMTFGGKFDGYR